jgi:hypothetical protein
MVGLKRTRLQIAENNTRLSRPRKIVKFSYLIKGVMARCWIMEGLSNP